MQTYEVVGWQRIGRLSLNHADNETFLAPNRDEIEVENALDLSHAVARYLDVQALFDSSAVPHGLFEVRVLIGRAPGNQVWIVTLLRTK